MWWYVTLSHGFVGFITSLIIIWWCAPWLNAQYLLKMSYWWIINQDNVRLSEYEDSLSCRCSGETHTGQNWDLWDRPIRIQRLGCVQIQNGVLLAAVSASVEDETHTHTHSHCCAWQLSCCFLWHWIHSNSKAPELAGLSSVCSLSDAPLLFCFSADP